MQVGCAPRTAQAPRTRMRAADPDDLIYLGLERQIILLGKVLCILHHLKDINGGRGTHNHAGPRSIGIDRQHAGHGDCGGNDSCRENDRDLAHGALLSLLALLARLLLPATPCPDGDQPPLVFANQARKYSTPKLRVAENLRPLLALRTKGARAPLAYTSSAVGRCSGGSETALKREEVEPCLIPK